MIALPEQALGESRRRWILSGAPGAGKTVLLRQLEIAGYAVVEEAATDVIALAQAAGEPEPWRREDFIDRIVALQAARQRRAAAGRGLQFFDRSPICTHALCAWLGFAVPDILARELERDATQRIYARQVLFVRNIGFIKATAARQISFEDAQAFEAVHEASYRAFGYELIDIPALGFVERAALVEEIVGRPSG